MSVKHVLVLCTGNSCRSVMAEALINAQCAGRYRAVSAGSQPVGFIHPGSMETLRRHGIPAGEPRSKSWDEFADQDFDMVITVCDQAASEHCPAFPGTPRRLHWSIPDPAQEAGSEGEINRAFDTAFALLRDHIVNELS